MEVVEAVVKGENHGPRGQAAGMKAFQGLAERQNVASGFPQRLESAAQQSGRYIEFGIPAVFVIQGHAVVTEDDQAIAPPICYWLRRRNSRSFWPPDRPLT